MKELTQKESMAINHTYWLITRSWIRQKIGLLICKIDLHSSYMPISKTKVISCFPYCYRCKKILNTNG